MTDSVPAPKPPELKTLSFPGRIHLIVDDAEAGAALTTLSREKILGFDTETRPTFKVGQVHKVAMLQLATETDAYLFRLLKLKNPAMILPLLQDAAVIKVGAAIRDDMGNLRKEYPIQPAGFVELQDLAKKRGLKNFGLRGMTAEVLEGRLSKAAQMTNWEAATLTPPQLLYAATDAWVGLKLYERLRDERPVRDSARD